MTKLAIILTFLPTLTGAFSCRDESGNPVDWWYISKIPDKSGYTQPQVGAGTAYLYQDVNSQGAWKLGSQGIDTQSTGLYYTLKQIYDAQAAGDQSFYYGMYNDETPSGTETTAKAHAKGVQAFNTTQGFWILHSVPKFPPSNAFSYPSSGTKYGQSMICVTYPTTSNLDTIGTIMSYYYPEVYAVQMPSYFALNYPTLNNAMVNNYHVSTAPYTHIATLTSSGGQHFNSYAKTRDWGQDLYADFLAPSLQTSLLVETWQDGAGDLPSVCSTYSTWTLNELNPGNVVDYTTTNDHSKWACSNTQNKPYICVGDINRQSSQYKRGGGTLCMNKYSVWQTYNSSVIHWLQCDGTISTLKEKAEEKLSYFGKIKSKFCKHVYNFCG